MKYRKIASSANVVLVAVVLDLCFILFFPSEHNRAILQINKRIEQYEDNHQDYADFFDAVKQYSICKNGICGHWKTPGSIDHYSELYISKDQDILHEFSIDFVIKISSGKICMHRTAVCDARNGILYINKPLTLFFGEPFVAFEIRNTGDKTYLLPSSCRDVAINRFLSVGPCPCPTDVHPTETAGRNGGE